MKKILLSTMISASVATASAQMADGSVVPDFTGTDLNNNSHTLYDYLDDGYTVILDVSATWCGPCWSYHNTGALEDIWLNHGPAGEPGVSATTTDDVMILFIEGDNSTTLADLQGNTSGTTGDWITGTDYPIIDDAAIASLLEITYYPTMYTVYPDRIIVESGQSQDHYGLISADIAVHTPASGGVDGSLILSSGPGSSCGGLQDIAVTVQNKGDVSMPAGTTVSVSDGVSVLGSATTNGALNQFETEALTISVDLTNAASSNLQIEISAPGDVASVNNTHSVNAYAQVTGRSSIIVEAVLDPYGSEISWALTNSAGTTVATNPTYVNGPANQYDPRPDHLIAGLDPSECYTFTISDSYGDGMIGGAGSYFKLKDDDGIELFLLDQDFTTITNGKFRTASSIAVGTEENLISDLSVFPNPFSSTATIAFENGTSVETTITLTNAVGQIVLNKNLGEVIGFQNFEINGNDLGAGVYFVTISAGTKSTTKKVLLNK